MEEPAATWSSNPESNDWDSPGNWVPQTVPDQEGDVATFGVSTITDVSVPDFLRIGGIVFNAGASAYKISFNFSLYPLGVINNSGVTQNVDSSAVMDFDQRATAGRNIVYTNNGSSGASAFNAFFANSNAGSATFIMNGPLPGNESVPLRFDAHLQRR